MGQIRQESFNSYAARAARFGALATVSILLLFTFLSYFLPKDEFQLAKERILKNPKENLQKALELDPNYETTKELKKIVK